VSDFRFDHWPVSLALILPCGWVFAPVPDDGYASPATHAWGRTPVRATVIR
jgi:hypothetical protein